MNIVIIGTGNTATILGKKLKEAGHHIVQVFGRDASAASKLAYLFDTESTNYWSVIRKDADVYLIAVSDEAIQDVAKHVHVPGKVVAHTAASVKKDVLKNMSHHYGVLYPLQSLRKDMDELPEIPLFIDASDEVAKKKLEQLAQAISKEKVIVANDDERLKLHLAAVIASNFTNHLYKLAEDYCKKEQIDFKQLIPLIEETALRMKKISPAQAQTGPAIRHDEPTIQQHLALLEKYPQLKKIYEVMTESIQHG
ncbi:MAG TPA: Rossmann-like and DUF2520 domain-containing protein [Chitinophagaceae bacterium]|jgi:predicted short-subunit dehydrogenase-like oxidoreductase (DUF2520 family)|nr:Rossmann-like and DUF2520 domain-containing protein [Chitinophagaceae bacterium]